MNSTKVQKVYAGIAMLFAALLLFYAVFAGGFNPPQIPKADAGKLLVVVAVIMIAVGCYFFGVAAPASQSRYANAVMAFYLVLGAGMLIYLMKSGALSKEFMPLTQMAAILEIIALVWFCQGVYAFGRTRQQ